MRYQHCDEQFTLFSVSHLHSESSWDTSCSVFTSVISWNSSCAWFLSPSLIHCWFYLNWAHFCCPDRGKKRYRNSMKQFNNQKKSNASIQEADHLALENEELEEDVERLVEKLSSAREERDNWIFAQEECDCNLVAGARAKHWLSAHGRAQPHR